MWVNFFLQNFPNLSNILLQLFILMTWNLYWQAGSSKMWVSFFQFFSNPFNLFHRTGDDLELILAGSKTWVILFHFFIHFFPSPYQLVSSIFTGPPGDDLELILAESKMWVSQRWAGPKLQFEIKMTFLHLARILMENMSCLLYTSDAADE